jgi:peptide/nickel transport system substrate-binding protein
VADEQGRWKQFRELTLDRRRLSKGVKRAEGATVRHAHKFIVTRLDNIRSVRRHIIGWLLLVGIMILAVGAQFMWFQQSYQTVAAARGGTYAEASLGPIDTLNPLYAASSAEITASRLLFSSLYNYDSTGHLRGDLAERVDIDQTQMIYTVTLRSDATWHDGSRLTAEDVAFTVNLIKNSETRSSLRVNWQDVNVKALNDTTVQFQLPAVYASFPNALTFAVLPKHVLGSVAPGAVRENTFSNAPIGSGPFSFRLLQTASDANRKHKIVHMTAYNAYYGGAAMLSRFEVHAYENQEAILRALRTGEVSAAADLTGVDVSRIDTHNYDIVNKPINSGVYALFNVDAPLLKERAVRQALELATNTRTIRAGLSLPVLPLDLPFISGQLTGDDIPHPAAYDVARAGAVLDEAGWLVKDGVRTKGDQKLELTIATTKNSQYEKVLAVLASQWQAIGVTINTNVVNTADPSTNFVQNILQARNYDVLLYELFIGADPDVYAYWHSSQIGMRGYNLSNYANGVSDAALASARSRLEPDLRNAKYKSFAKQWIEDVPAIGLYQPIVEYVSNNHVHSVDPFARQISSYDRFSNILDWSVNQKPVYKTP